MFLWYLVGSMLKYPKIYKSIIQLLFYNISVFLHNHLIKFMQMYELPCALIKLGIQIKIFKKFCYNYILVHVNPHRNYNWTTCEELLLSRLSEI